MSTPTRSASSSQPRAYTALLCSQARPLTGLMRWALLLLLALGLISCQRNEAPIAESQYSTKLVGDWMGTVGNNNETISFQVDGGFSSQVRPMGFISNTLGQGVTGTISGTWKLKGKVITLTIDNAENEQLLNTETTSTIMNFQENEMVVKSSTGKTSTFIRDF